MITATVLAIFFVPVFFVLIMRYFTKYISPEEKAKIAKEAQEKIDAVLASKGKQ